MYLDEIGHTLHTAHRTTPHHTSFLPSFRWLTLSFSPTRRGTIMIDVHSRQLEVLDPMQTLKKQERTIRDLKQVQHK